MPGSFSLISIQAVLDEDEDIGSVADTSTASTPDIIVTAPSTPSLTEDDTPSSGEDSRPSSPSPVAALNVPGYTVSEEDCTTLDTINALLDELEALVVPKGPLPARDTGTVAPLDTIQEEDSLEMLAYLADDTSTPSNDNTLAPVGLENCSPGNVGVLEKSESARSLLELAIGFPAPSVPQFLATLASLEDDATIYQLSFPSINILTPDASVQLAYTISEVNVCPAPEELPTMCHIVEEPETEAATQDSVDPSAVTPATSKRSSIKSAGKTTWKAFKRSISLPNVVNGIAIHGKEKLASVKEAVKSKSPLSKLARKGKHVKQGAESAQVTTDARPKRRSFTAFF